MKLIVLGNANPKKYRKNPDPPSGLSTAMLEIFAKDICALDISDIPPVGTEIMTKPEPEAMASGAKPEVAYIFTDQHRSAALKERIEKPVEMPWMGGKCRTKIQLAPTSTPSESLREIREIVKAHFNGPIGWIAGNDTFMVEAVRQEFGIKEVRELDMDLIDVEPKGK